MEASTNQSNPKTSLVIFDDYRIKHFQWHSNDPSPYISLQNIDLLLLLELYPDQFPQEITNLLRALTKREISILEKRNWTLHLGNPAITDWKELEAFQRRFNDILVSDSKLLKYRLQNHYGTILFVCLYFYCQLWDYFGIEFNGPASEYNIKELKVDAQPFTYRNVVQLKTLSKIFYNHYLTGRKKKKTHSVEFNLNNGIHSIDDPTYTYWITEALINSFIAGTYPAASGYVGELLSKLLKSQSSFPSHDDFLVELKKLTELNESDFLPRKNTKRAVVKKFCIEIHKIVSRLMKQPVDKFLAEQLRLYNQILILLEMDDFSTSRKEYENEPQRKRQVETRLRALLLDDSY